MPEAGDQPAPSQQGRSLTGFYVAVGVVAALVGLGVLLYKPMAARYWVWKMAAYGPGAFAPYTWKYLGPELRISEPMEKLKTIGRPAIPLLVEALGDPDETRSAMARDTLRHMTDAPAARLRRGKDGRMEWARDKIVSDCRAWWEANRDRLEWDSAQSRFLTPNIPGLRPPQNEEPSRQVMVIILEDTPYSCRVVRHDKETVTAYLLDCQTIVTVDWDALAPVERGLSGPKVRRQGQTGEPSR